MAKYSLMHRRANYLFAGSAILFALVWIGQFYLSGPWYDALYWVSQSALIGSVADWFAVSALFRKPLGIPFHTALIPRNRDRFIRGTINLVETKLLTKGRCQAIMDKISFVDLLDSYLSSKSGQRSLAIIIDQGLRAFWESRSQTSWAQLGSDKVKSFLRDQSLLPVLQHILLDLCEHNRYESMVVEIIEAVQARLREPALLYWLAAFLEEETQKKKKNFLSDFLISFSEASDVINYEDMAASILVEAHRTLDAWKEPNNPERIAWLRQWVSPVKGMSPDSEVAQSLNGAWRSWVEGLGWAGLLEIHVLPYLDALLGRGDQEGASSLARLLSESLIKLWVSHRDQEDFRISLEANLHGLAGQILDQAYGLLGVIIRHVLEGLTGQKFVDFIESKVEDDLAWIRINGALVGGLGGLLLWGLLSLLDWVVA